MTSACVSAFILNISVAMENVFPMKIIKSHPSDMPWMTASLKNLSMLITPTGIPNWKHKSLVPLHRQT
jgi:hypothetical protein